MGAEDSLAHLAQGGTIAEIDQIECQFRDIAEIAADAVQNEPERGEDVLCLGRRVAWTDELSVGVERQQSGDEDLVAQECRMRVWADGRRQTEYFQFGDLARHQIGVASKV